MVELEPHGPLTAGVAPARRAAPGTLVTSRLELGPWREGDWVSLARITSDPEMMRFIGDGQPWSSERTRSYVEAQRAHYEARGYCYWRVTLRGSGELVGLCGLNHCHDGDEDIGWWVARPLWGQGLATEAAGAALSDALGRLRMRRVIATTRSSNAAAIRVMENLGMRFVKRVDPADVVLYELKRPSRWRRVPG